MYKSILKKDLKRKRTMNIILLIFISLSVMFVSSSGNNLNAVSSALDNYMQKANVPDYFIVTRGEAPTGRGVEELIKNLDYVSVCKSNDCIYAPLECISYNGKKVNLKNQSMIVPFDGARIKYFDQDNKEITYVNEGEIYLKKSIMTDNDIQTGDKITLDIDNVSVDLTVKGCLKDAVFGSAMMGNTTFALNQSDYAKFEKADSYSSRYGKFIYVQTTDQEALSRVIADDPTIMYSESRAGLKTTYIMDMIIAGLLLIVSVFLIIIAFVILRFTISFTLSEEFREIGIMKAIGITNSKIRGLYMIKYFVISVAGAVLGFIFGVPFGNMLLKQASDNMVIASDNIIFINLILSVAVVAVIMLFCYRCTVRVEKFTPIDAVRNGQTGERFKRKGIIHLSKSHLRPIPFMAVNDILSSLKRFIIVAVSFTIGILLITIPLNTMTTLQSDKIISWFGMTRSDVYMGDKGIDDKYINSNGHKKLEEYLNSMEEKLADNGIDANCSIESLFKFTIEKRDIKTKSLAMQGVGSTTDQYTYIEGTAPINNNEVAITHLIADRINAKIGDTVKITTLDGTKDYIVTAVFQSMNNMGEGIRFTENVEFDYAQCGGFFAYQITYKDNPTDAEKAERMELIKDIFPDCEVYNGSEYIDRHIGGVAGYMSGVVYLIVCIVIIINILVAVLMEKSFFTREKSEIAMMKAIGFTNRSIIIKQTLRMAIIMIFATLVAIALAYPVGQLAVGGIFRIMGAMNIIFDVNILQTYIIYPLIVLICTIISVIIVNQQVRSVSSSEINNIE